MSGPVKLKSVAMNFNLKDLIYDALRTAIFEMNIYDESTDLRLDERSLAEQLGTSRTPVREALSRLEQEGFVDILPRKGIFVKRKSLNEVLEMLVVWAALESMAARIVTERATAAEFKSLRRFARKFSQTEASAALEEYSDANIQFHQRILELSRCELLLSTANNLFVHMVAIRRRAMGENDRAMRSVVDHMNIIEALESRDPDLAAKRVREHTLQLHDHIRREWVNLESLGTLMVVRDV